MGGGGREFFFGKGERERVFSFFPPRPHPPHVPNQTKKNTQVYMCQLEREGVGRGDLFPWCWDPTLQMDVMGGVEGRLGWVYRVLAHWGGSFSFI